MSGQPAQIQSFKVSEFQGFKALAQFNELPRTHPRETLKRCHFETLQLSY